MKKFLRYTAAPLLAAMLWGTAFSEQNIAGQYITPFCLCGIRSLAAAVLLFLAAVIKRRTVGSVPFARKEVCTAALVTGSVLYVAMNFQQFGINETTAGKSGFVTALYMVLVPIAAGFMGRKTEKKIWAAVILALAGLYFLCIKGSFRLEKGDIFLLCCAFGYTGQILAVDHYAQRVDSIELCCGQFLVGGILSLITAFFMEDVGGVHLGACIWPVVYLVVFSNCIAYTLQIVAQDGGNPTLVSLLFSMESVFAVLAGAVILKERLSGRELLGCGLIFAAVILAELPVRPVKRHRDGGRRIHDLY